ncbi:hypothetical protein DFQ50_1344 [Pseudocitrobacter faecalis]|uniref:Uncharacterized protein n=1 Tax=Pseudocitrobacter faecalis TaxID=1398493 RepID=A0ABX9FRD7_9ENTR|nr:hypothetical protein DFQ50_1344 [Pseudocitrobacter faecalis]
MWQMFPFRKYGINGVLRKRKIRHDGLQFSGLNIFADQKRWQLTNTKAVKQGAANRFAVIHAKVAFRNDFEICPVLGKRPLAAASKIGIHQAIVLQQIRRFLRG